MRNTTPKPESVEEIVKRFQEVLSNYEKKIVDVHPTDYFKETLTTHASHAYTRGREEQEENTAHTMNNVLYVLCSPETTDVVAHRKGGTYKFTLPTPSTEALSTNTENK